MKLNLKSLFLFYSKYIFAFCIIFFLDFITKILAKIFLSDFKSIEIIPNLFNLKLAFNTGVAFSAPVPYFLQIISGGLMLGGIFWWARNYFEEISVGEKWGTTLLLAGASGNLWERIISQHVTDFLYFYHNIFFTLHFPIFNIADISIFFGVMLWFFYSVSDGNNPKPNSL